MNYLFVCFALAFVGLTFAQTCSDENEEYKECGTACPRTCANPIMNKMCIDVCKSGCFCKEPYIRDQKTSKCVLQAKCTGVCSGPNERYTNCGSACPKTCANMNEIGKVCIALCVSGCFCNPGYVRNNNGTCVLTRDCPQAAEAVCVDPNEVYNSCGSACPTTCKNYKNPPMCIQVCRAGCFCKSPYVRDNSGKCVLTKECVTK